MASQSRPPHAYAHKLVTSAQGGASTEAYPPPAGTHVDASVSTYGFACPSLLPPSPLVPWRWLPRSSLSQPPLPSPTATTRLTPAPARTGINELVLKLVLGSLSAASLLYKPETKPARSAKRPAMPSVVCTWPLGLAGRADPPVCARERQ